ncbi:MAG TPA: helix-turn-helix domain-containing protein [Paenibacillus sp.]|nr:helix-turn-helix domain-containing protein [Paenibacillus sp.]
MRGTNDEAQYVESYTPPHGVLLADRFRVEAGYYGHRPGGSKDWLILYTLGGEGALRRDGGWLSASAGDVVLYPPGAAQHYETGAAGAWDFLWAHFVPEPHWTEWLRLPLEGGLLRHRLREDERDRFRQAFERLIADGMGADKHRLALAMSALSELLVLLHRSCYRDAPRGGDERIADVLNEMALRLQEPLTLPELARVANLSISRFCHLFKEETGESALETLTKLRLQKSCRLLELTSRLVSEVAADVGFPSPFYFTRKFKEHYGVSPTAYRRNSAR